MTDMEILFSEIESLHKKVRKANDAVACGNAELESLRQQLGAKDATICGLREAQRALEALGSKPDGYCFCVERAQVEAGHTGECLQAQRAISSITEVKEVQRESLKRPI